MDPKILKRWKSWKTIFRNLSGIGSSSLIGRDVVSLKSYMTEDIQQILWTGIDLKNRSKQNEVLNLLHGKTMAYIFQQHCDPNLGLAASAAMTGLGGGCCFIPVMDNPDEIRQLGRSVASLSSLNIVDIKSHNLVEELANESNVPVITARSSLSSPVCVLADFMTLLETYNYLKRLKVAWIGGITGSLCSLITAAPQVGIHVNVSLPPNCQIPSDIMNNAVKLSVEHRTNLHIGHDSTKAAYRVHAVITDRCSDELGSDYLVTKKMMDEADLEWSFLHPLPRSPAEVTDEVFYHKRCLAWKSIENRKWIIMALAIHLTQEYKATISSPVFEKDFHLNDKWTFKKQKLLESLPLSVNSG